MKRFKILVIPPFFPFPANDGGKICIFGFIDYLRKYHDFHLFVPIRTQDELDRLGLLKKMWNNVTIHVVEELPRPSQFSKAKQFLKKQPIIWLVDFIRSAKSRFRKKKKAIDPYQFYQNTKNTFPFFPFGVSYVNELTSILSANHFDIVQTELTPMLNLIHLFPRTAKRVFVHIESREDVLNDYGRFNSIDKPYADYITSSAAFCEYGYMSLYDAVFALNDHDKELIKLRCPGLKVFTSPFAILESQITRVDTNSYKAQRLIFIGGDNHFPNHDGLRWFLTDVIPQFKIDLPDLFVTGQWKKSTQNEFSKYYPKIHFTGFVDDLRPYLENSIAIVPIRIGGGGIRTKILFAMANNIPIVTTPLASIGIQGIDKTHFMVADSAADFANSISELLLHPAIAKRLIDNSEKLVNSEYSQKVVSDRRNEYYHQIMEM
jgi:glycosyltransferase involved in cell wall biosynthesis